MQEREDSAVVGGKNREKDGGSMVQIMVDVMNKKQMCVVVGNGYMGKQYVMMEVYKTSGIGPV